jgi:hypothetical protein
MYKSRLFKDIINIADERSVSLIERGIKCCIDQRVVRVDLKSRVGKVKSLPCTGFVWELNRETLRRFPVLFDFDRYGRLLGIMILS